MARQSRLCLPDQLHYVVQPCTQCIFLSAADHYFFIQTLGQYARAYAVQIHGYALLPDQFHLLLTPLIKDDLSELLKRAARAYISYFHRTYQRKGPLWQGRYRAGIIQADYFLAALAWVESLPLQQELVAAAKTYPWSSYRRHSGEEVCAAPDEWLHPHPHYLLLANLPFEREQAYCQYFHQATSAASNVIGPQIYAAAYYNWVYGDEAFIHALALKLPANRRLTKGKPGRPIKQATSLAI